MGCLRPTISSFIGTNKAILILIAAIVSGCKGSDAAKLGGRETPVAVSKDTLYSRCTAESCSLFATGKAGKKIFVEKGSRATTIHRIARDIFRATSSCGSPCSEALYYDARNGKKAGYFPDVIAEDTSEQWIAYMDGPTVIVRCIFPCSMTEKKFTPALAPSATPRSTVQEAHFKNGHLVLHYLKGQEFEPTVDTLTIKTP